MVPTRNQAWTTKQDIEVVNSSIILNMQYVWLLHAYTGTRSRLLLLQRVAGASNRPGLKTCSFPSDNRVGDHGALTSE